MTKLVSEGEARVLPGKCIHLDSFTAELAGDVLKSPGVDWGAPLRVVLARGKHLIVHRKGHMAWSGNYQPYKYTGAKYMLLRLDRVHVAAKESLNGHAYDKTTATVLQACVPGRRCDEAVCVLTSELHALEGGA